MEILVGLVVIAGLGYLAWKKSSGSTAKAEETEAPYKVEVAPVIVTAPKAEAPAPVVEVATTPAAKPAKAKKPKAPAIKAKPKAEAVAKETKPKAPKKPKSLKVAK